MELPEILSLIAVIFSFASTVLLVILLLRPKKHEGGVDTDALARSLSDAMRREITEPLRREEKEGQSTLRAELRGELRDSRTEMATTVQNSMDKLGQTLRESQRETAELQAKRIADLTASEERRMEALNTLLSQRLAEVEKQFRVFREQSATAQEQLRRDMENRMVAMQERNEKQLEEMRATVDEKLQKTLNERISQSFETVNKRLAEVHQGLGEMQTLAGDVGDLKKVMAGVKTRGILGEIQLGAIISEILSPEQYEENIATIPGSANRVEFAVRLPGEGDTPIYLPIDAKFPADAYHHLVDAYEEGDTDRIKSAATELERRIKDAAKDIRDKYVSPPYTTTFGIMFLPFEGLYAEVVRMGLVDILQNQYHVSVAGPTTLAALLNSLQMGFRTLAIQKRSGEVWEVLGAVKTEFGNFEKVLSKAKERIDQTGDELDKLIGTRTRQINRKLKSVAELPAADAKTLLDGVIADEE